MSPELSEALRNEIEGDAKIATATVLSGALNKKLHKIHWQQDLARRGQERKESVSPELSEALRNEIRTALDAGGKPFDVNVARRVYDLAIAARDMCVAATGSVKEAIDQIKDTNGPMETLQDPDAPESPLQVSETYGARVIRELMAIVPKFLLSGGDDPKKLVHALAEARLRSMHDVAEELEVKLFGQALSGPRPVSPTVAVNLGSFEHGFSDGKLHRPPESDEPDYQAGYLRGNEAHYLGSALVPDEAGALASKVERGQRIHDHGGRVFELRMQDRRSDDLLVYLCGCGLPIRQFEKEALDCPQRPRLLVTIGYEPAIGSLLQPPKTNGVASEERSP